MTVSYSQLPAFIARLQAASRVDHLWFGFDSRLQQLSASDLVSFETEARALDFQHYQGTQGRGITLLSTEGTQYFIEEVSRILIKEGDHAPNILLDAKTIKEIHEDILFNYGSAMFEEWMDSFDWSKTFYDPLQANTEIEKPWERIQFIRLEFLVEQLSAFALTGEKQKAYVTQLMERHWKDQPMEVQIEAILNGGLVGAVVKNEEQTLINHKTDLMNENNFSYLKDNVKYSGFGESLYPEMERNILEKKPEFHPHYSAVVDKRPFEADLHFRKSSTSDMYFFNGYTAAVTFEDGEKRVQSFLIKKGKGVTAKEAFNMLEGRPIKKELTNAKGEAYTKWRQLDFTKKDERGNYKEIRYDEKQFNLKGSIGIYSVPEMDGAEKEEALLRSIERGNRQLATIEAGGDTKKVYFEANPKDAEVKVYNEGMVLMAKDELVPFLKTVGQDVAQTVGEGVTQAASGQKNTQGVAGKNGVGQKEGVKEDSNRRVRKRGQGLV